MTNMDRHIKLGIPGSVVVQGLKEAMESVGVKLVVISDSSDADPSDFSWIGGALGSYLKNYLTKQNE